MRELSRLCALCVLAGIVAACGLTTGGGSTGPTVPPITPEQKATASPANPDAALLADFNARLATYVQKQRALAAEIEGVKEETTKPAEIVAAHDQLAARIRQIRANAKQGDIFTPQIAGMFRRLIAAELKQEGAEAKANAADEWSSVALKVNATYPASQPLSMAPPNILARLPQLPPDVDYRIVEGRHLVLRDVDANMIIDYIPNAMR